MALLILIITSRNLFVTVYPHLYCAPQGLPHHNFAKVFDDHKKRMIGLPWKNYGNKNYVKPFIQNTGTWRTDRQTDRITISCGVCWRAIRTCRPVIWDLWVIGVPMLKLNLPVTELGYQDKKKFASRQLGLRIERITLLLVCKVRVSFFSQPSI